MTVVVLGPGFGRPTGHPLDAVIGVGLGLGAAGIAFSQAAYGVWLTDHVRHGYLSGWPG